MVPKKQLSRVYGEKNEKKMLKVNLEGGSHKKIPRNLTIIIQYKNLIYNEHFK